MANKRIILFLTVATIVLGSCKERYIPKPRGYFRIEIPEHKYQPISKSYPYLFDINLIAQTADRRQDDEQYWIDVVYPTLNAKLHCSYKHVDNNLRELTDDAEGFVYKHSGMADAIPEQGYEDEAKQVYGVYYELKGNIASPVQFFLTDSTDHFFRAALYFDCIPNADSLAPVVDYMIVDIRHLIESFQWR